MQVNNAAPATVPNTDVQLRAAHNMLRQGRSFDELPPPLQRAWLADQRDRNPQGHARQVQAHANEAPAAGPDSLAGQAAYGLKTSVVDPWKRATAQDKVEAAEATERDLYQQRLDRAEVRMAARDPRRYEAYRKQQKAAEQNLAADANPETWRRREAASAEEKRSAELLTHDPKTWASDLARRDPAHAARIAAQQERATANILDDSASDAVDRGAINSQIRDDEQRLLARDRGRWLASLPADRRAALEARDGHDRESIMASGLEAVHHRDAVEDVLTFGASSALKHDGAGAAALELVTLGTYGMTARGGSDLGRASAYADQAAQLRRMGVPTDAARLEQEAAQMRLRGSFQVGLGAANVLMMTGTAGAATRQALERAGLIRATETEATVVAGQEMAAMGRAETTTVLGRAETTVLGRTETALGRAETAGAVHAPAPVPGRRLHTSEVRTDPHPDPTAWTDVGAPGRQVSSRREGSQVWHREGANEWTIRGSADELAAESARQGSRGLCVFSEKGPVMLRVHGNPSPHELNAVRASLDALPVGHRHVMKDIYLTENLGHVRSGNAIAGLAGPESMILERRMLGTPGSRTVIYHEIGHGVDFDLQLALRQKSRVKWGEGVSVTDYGATNGVEDFAETYAFVMENRANPLKMLNPRAFGKKVDMARLTQVPMVAPEAIGAAAAGVGVTGGVWAWLAARSRPVGGNPTPPLKGVQT